MAINIRYAGRFRDAVFYFSGSAPTTGGRKTVIREFPGSNRRYVEDLGLLNKSFEIDAIVTTQYEKERLIKALETPGIGQLSHPTFGLINVTAQPYTVTDSIQNEGYCSFRLVFNVSQENIYPTSSWNNISFLQSKNSWLNNSIINGFTTAIRITSDTIQTAIRTVDEVVEVFEIATAGIDEIRYDIDAVKESVVSIIQTPGKFINSIKSIITSVKTFTNDPKAAFNILKKMTIKDDTKKKILTVKQAENAKVENTIKQAVNLLVLNEIYDNISEIDYDNNEELDDIKNQVETIYEDIIDNPTEFLIEISSEDDTNNILENLQEVRQVINSILSEKENTVAKVVEVETYNTTLNDFVFLYYGNLDYLDKIEAINNINDRSNISGRIKVLAI